MIDNIFEKYSTNFEDLKIGDTIAKIIKSPWILEDVFFHNGERLIISWLLFHFIYPFLYSKFLGIVYIFCYDLCWIDWYIFVSECIDSVQYLSIYLIEPTEIEDTLSNLISIYTSNKVGHESGRIKILSKYIYDTQRKKLKCYGKYRLRFTIVFVIIFAILNILSFTLYLRKNHKYWHSFSDYHN